MFSGPIAKERNKWDVFAIPAPENKTEFGKAYQEKDCYIAEWYV
jgi:hypothetical protein